jgi:tetratricopeptide (TPR) repeat protein
MRSARAPGSWPTRWSRRRGRGAAGASTCGPRWRTGPAGLAVIVTVAAAAAVLASPAVVRASPAAAVLASSAVRRASPAAADRTHARTLDAGARLYHAGRLAEAEATVVEAVRAHPTDPHGWLWLGAIRYRQGEVAWAVRAFEYVARRRPRDPVPLLWLGYAHLNAGRPTDAAVAFRRVLLLPAGTAAHTLARQGLRAVDPLPAVRGRPGAASAWATDPATYQRLALHYNPDLSPPVARMIGDALVAYSRQFDVDPRLVAALVIVESGFQPRARSRAGAIGLGQLMPGTASALGVDPDDPVQNLYGTVRYLRGNLDRFGWERVHLALAAYNAGRGAVERYEGIPPYEETRWYVTAVSRLYRRLLDM